MMPFIMRHLESERSMARRRMSGAFQVECEACGAGMRRSRGSLRMAVARPAENRGRWCAASGRPRSRATRHVGTPGVVG